TDGDGDTVSGDVNLTLYPDANTWTGTPDGDTHDGDAEANNILGADGNDTLNGLAGDDVLSGGIGSDTLDGGADNDALFVGSGDDTLDGGSGLDTFKVAEGNDTITDYSLADGDVVDISGVIDTGAGDYLAVSKNLDDNSVKLSVFDSSDIEKGSVSFDNIDYDTDLTTGDELDSLLGQINIDDGTEV
ncbi:MAG: hypothetical protein JRD39_00860, partial [Deltaproteobacteria bacterium]|nr:hypothetical protein [Deltaproteobacteria bacterium]